VLVRPKDGERIVPLPPELVPVLRAHRAAQSRARLEVGSMWTDHDLVFTQWNGAPIDPRQDWGEWKQPLAGAGVRDARVHDARHIAGTVLVELGVDIRGRVNAAVSY
jgi:integrase